MTLEPCSLGEHCDRTSCGVIGQAEYCPEQTNAQWRAGFDNEAGLPDGFDGRLTVESGS